MRGCVSRLVVVVVLAAAALGGAAYLLNRAPETATAITPVIASDDAAASFDRKVGTMQRAGAPATIEITDEEATSKLVEALATEPDAPNITDAQVNFRDGRLYLSGTARETPLAVKVVIVGRLEARDGHLVATVEQIDTGRIPLPAAMRDQITDAATSLDELNRRLPIYVTAVDVLDGRLTLTGRPKGD